MLSEAIVLTEWLSLVRAVDASTPPANEQVSMGTSQDVCTAGMDISKMVRMRGSNTFASNSVGCEIGFTVETRHTRSIDMGR